MSKVVCRYHFFKFLLTLAQGLLWIYVVPFHVQLCEPLMFCLVPEATYPSGGSVAANDGWEVHIIMQFRRYVLQWIGDAEQKMMHGDVIFEVDKCARMNLRGLGRVQNLEVELVRHPLDVVNRDPLINDAKEDSTEKPQLRRYWKYNDSLVFLLLSRKED